MANVVQGFCDAVAADLLTNVQALSALGSEQVHLYLPVPEDEVALGQERHLGVWLVGDTTAPLSSDSHERTQVYQVSVWENMAESGGRLAQDVVADLAFLDLYDAVLGRFYKIANEMLGGMELSWPGTAALGSSSGFIRRLVINLETKRYWPFT